jgi:hypothetical protein
MFKEFSVFLVLAEKARKILSSLQKTTNLQVTGVHTWRKQG